MEDVVGAPWRPEFLTGKSFQKNNNQIQFNSHFLEIYGKFGYKIISNAFAYTYNLNEKQYFIDVVARKIPYFVFQYLISLIENYVEPSKS